MKESICALLVLLVLTGCDSAPASAPANASAVPATAPAAPQSAITITTRAADDPLPPETSPYDALPGEVGNLLEQPFTGDFDEIVKRRLIRVGTVYNRTHYFIDKGAARGLAYEGFKQFEDDLNKKLKTGLLKIHVVLVPLSRDQLFTSLQSGRVDVVAASLTVTPEREKMVAFTLPTTTNVSEIVVTQPGGPRILTPEELSGHEVFVRKSSSYYESLQRLNEKLTAAGKPPVVIKEAPESLEDDDILEMVNAGLIGITVMDDFMVNFWKQVFPGVQAHTAALRTGAVLAGAVRKDNPKLLAELNAWITQVGMKSTFANVLRRKYMQNTTYVKSAAADAERKKLQSLVKYFEVYGQKYSVDYLLMAAQGYQESGLDQTVRSHVGAIGVMQVMPATGKDLAVGDITQTEANIHAGVKYFRFMIDEFYKDEPMEPIDKGLMTLASYNAGPGRIRQLRRETARRGLDPNKWFGNVERVVSERIGRETVTYVSNIYKYYVAYKLVMDREQQRQKARTEARQ
jgi:membrane-bound lytic murein transglycosylase MltF